MKTKMKEQRTQPVNEAILLSAADCARMCGISRRSWFRFSASLRTPACVYVGASPRWRRNDIERWVSMGCPNRKEFETFKDMAK